VPRRAYRRAGKAHVTGIVVTPPGGRKASLFGPGCVALGGDQLGTVSDRSELVPETTEHAEPGWVSCATRISPSPGNSASGSDPRDSYRPLGLVQIGHGHHHHFELQVHDRNSSPSARQPLTDHESRPTITFAPVVVEVQAREFEMQSATSGSDESGGWRSRRRPGPNRLWNRGCGSRTCLAVLALDCRLSAGATAVRTDRTGQRYA
jgi:hypothetical protein